MRGRVLRWLRLPLLHFLIGGALAFGLLRGVRPDGGAGDPAAAPVIITAADVATMRAAYARETGLQPSAADEAALVEQAIDEEVLFREAIARRLDRDRSVRSWLIEQMRILSDDTAATDDALYARAIAIGLDQKDLVVRRILVQKVRLLAARAGEEHVDEDALRRYHEAHAAAYRQPARVSAWHLYLTPPRAAAAEALLVAARAGGLDAAAAARRGDPFPQPPRLVGQSRQQLVKLFGSDVAEQVLNAPERTWVGPLRSPLGVHLFWIEAHTVAADPSFEAVRGRVLEGWRQERRAQQLAGLLHALRNRQPLQVESAAWRERNRA